MSVKQVPSYRVVCDGEDCEASPSDEGDYWCWAQVDGALDDLANAYGWYSSTRHDRHLCHKHAPRCQEPDCGVTLTDDEWGVLCEDHAPDLKGTP